MKMSLLHRCSLWEQQNLFVSQKKVSRKWANTAIGTNAVNKGLGLSPSHYLLCHISELCSILGQRSPMRLEPSHSLRKPVSEVVSSLISQWLSVQWPWSILSLIPEWPVCRTPCFMHDNWWCPPVLSQSCLVCLHINWNQKARQDRDTLMSSPLAQEFLHSMKGHIYIYFPATGLLAVIPGCFFLYTGWGDAFFSW